MLRSCFLDFWVWLKISQAWGPKHGGEDRQLASFPGQSFDDLHDNNLVCSFEKTADKLLPLHPFTYQLLQFDDTAFLTALERLKRVGPSGQMPARSH